MSINLLLKPLLQKKICYSHHLQPVFHVQEYDGRRTKDLLFTYFLAHRVSRIFFLRDTQNKIKTLGIKGNEKADRQLNQIPLLPLYILYITLNVSVVRTMETDQGSSASDAASSQH